MIGPEVGVGFTSEQEDERWERWRGGEPEQTEVGDDCFEVTGEPRPRGEPWHRLGPHPPAAPTG